ncbi:DUF6020 family protein [Bifidobacterium dentium]|uniref:DUF6020 family protein n=1 Tax=Bifidobacterium dentium TaxID=1689 RepID=UPI0022E2BE6F|nr:DUF6020 family protein [Bifidobacterium dentium]
MNNRKKVMQALSGILISRMPLIILALICGFMAALVNTLRVSQHLVFTGRCIWFTVITFCLFIILVLLGEYLIAWLSKEPKSSKPVFEKLRLLFSFKWGWRQFILVAAVILLCWMPYLLLTYPGIIWYDTGQQLMQWFGLPNTFTDGSHWSDHHPVFDTLFFGIFAELGKFVGSVDRGLFLCSVTLAVLSTTSFTTVIVYCRRLGARWRICFTSMLFFALFPVIPMFSMSLVKDSVFVPFFIWFALICVEIARTRGVCLRRPSIMIAFMLIVLLMGLTKKTGMYVALICCLALFFTVLGKYRLRVGAVLLTELVVMLLFIPKVVFPAFCIQEGGKQEMLSIPFQQSALEVKRHKSDIDSKDLEAITNILGEDVADRYQWWAADNVKGYTWDSDKDQYLDEYAKAWVCGLVKHPGTYIEAYLAMQEGWLGIPAYGETADPTNLLLPVFLAGSNHTLVGYAPQMGMHAPGHVYRVNQFERFMDRIEQLPVLNLIFSRAIWATWMFIFVIYEWCRHRRKNILWLFPYIATFLFLWISPATVTIEGIRYVMPMVVITPLMWGLLTVHLQSDN